MQLMSKKRSHILLAKSVDYSFQNPTFLLQLVIIQDWPFAQIRNISTISARIVENSLSDASYFFDDMLLLIALRNDVQNRNSAINKFIFLLWRSSSSIIVSSLSPNVIPKIRSHFLGVMINPCPPTTKALWLWSQVIRISTNLVCIPFTYVKDINECVEKRHFQTIYVIPL